MAWTPEELATMFGPKGLTPTEKHIKTLEAQVEALDETNQALRKELRHVRTENDALSHMYQMAMQDLRGCREELVDVKRMLYGQQY